MFKTSTGVVVIAASMPLELELETVAVAHVVNVRERIWRAHLIDFAELEVRVGCTEKITECMLTEAGLAGVNHRCKAGNTFFQ